jgi:hypothetical protein
MHAERVTFVVDEYVGLSSEVRRTDVTGQFREMTAHPEFQVGDVLHSTGASFRVVRREFDYRWSSPPYLGQPRCTVILEEIS